MAANWLSPGDTAWQLTAATIVGLQSVPGLALLYGGIVKKKWAVNSAFMVFYAFAAVLIAWLLWAYNMGFGHQLLPFVGFPHPIATMADELKQAAIPAAGATAAFPMSAMVYFQFVFAAITLILIAGSVLGRMSFLAWMLFVPAWLTLSYTVGAFSLWGGGWLAQMGVIDYSGGYVIHLAAGIAGFTAAAVIGPRLPRDRENFLPNNVLIFLAGAGLLWLGWNGFNGGDPYAASADAGAAVLNTNVTTAMSLLVWTVLDYTYFGKPSAVGAVQGMITGLVAITPAAGFINGYEAILLGILSGSIPWFTMNVLGKKMALFRKVDDTLGVFHTHAVAGLLGGIFTGFFATKAGTAAFGVAGDYGLIYGNAYQVVKQLIGAGFIIVLNVVMTYIILKIIGFFVPLRMKEEDLLIGDDAIHGEEAYAFYGEGDRKPVRGD
ncbi:ammonium transporter [Acidihalobacter ferrooxydans]|uniref:Ammonium transporter n=1 Tax=Acidihalobacter ferrooxydans TaxID=1765967 RepID=A0A1P8UEL3_9GAMM|nr:ammonium transporter [Acidihalobacter ferrooxydans]APZ42204.1 ammonium transporter [Acidihalobacter ferrooxydans]